MTICFTYVDSRIESTYAKQSTSNLNKSLYDSYVKAFRWASDRISQFKEGGIVAFISNGSWLDGNAQDGMRKCFQNEFSSIYVLNLRGNQRTSGELSRKEGGKIFGSGSRTPITITFLIKNPAKQGKATIHYHDIGDYLTREQKLKIVRDFRSISNIEWQTIEPNEKNDWINMRDGSFDTLIPLFPNKKFSLKEKSFFSTYSLGIATNKDNFLYNSSAKKLSDTVIEMINYYNNERIKLAKNPNYELSVNETKIVWTDMFKSYAAKGIIFTFLPNLKCISLYRPYYKQNFIFQKELLQRTYQQLSLFPKPNYGNTVICVSGIGVTKDFSCIISNILPDLETIGKSQCFPLYWYEENKNRQKTLFDDETGEDYIRRDGITDWILKEVRSRYGVAKNITKEMIFYYVYGLLHSPDYRERFSADLKKSLPRIPIVENVEEFMDFYRLGKKLADLHLNYEDVEPYPDVQVIGDRQLTGEDSDYDYFRVVDKLRFKSKQDKSTIIYNGNIQINNIPEKAYEYVVNGKSAIEWIVERYCVSQDKKSLIRNDANDWAKEHGKPRYILDLLLSVINVSVQTVDIVKALPKLKFD